MIGRGWRRAGRILVPEYSLIPHMAQAGRAAGGGNPLWGNTISQIHFDGANGATSITDARGISWTRSGSPALTTTSPKFGTACSDHPSSPSMWISASNSGFAVSPGSVFCGEFWFRTSVVALRSLLHKGALSVTLDVLVRTNASQLMSLNLLGGSVTTTGAAGTYSTSAWNHCCFGCDGSQIHLGINGNLFHAANGSTPSGGTNQVQIGGMLSGGGQFTGQMDEFRWLNVWPYGSGSTYTVPTAAFGDS